MRFVEFSVTCCWHRPTSQSIIAKTLRLGTVSDVLTCDPGTDKSTTTLPWGSGMTHAGIVFLQSPLFEISSSCYIATLTGHSWFRERKKGWRSHEAACAHTLSPKPLTLNP